MPDKCNPPRWRVQYYDDYLSHNPDVTYICALDEKEAAAKFCDEDLRHKNYIALMVEGDGIHFLVWVEATIAQYHGLCSEQIREKANA